jgi:hypothetical protein
VSRCALACRETTEGLGRLIAKELAPGLAPSLVEQVDLGEEESAFTGVASQCLSVLVLGINTRLDACLQVRGRAIGTAGLAKHSCCSVQSVSVL